ncbi:PREDICTED: uncharacterized protein LOC109153867 [Ipomoea nil]|uniref:uncharacterized protein LOC109153867 n=1 Tax=Ipomoea nil TaxID=35883 RepID=UPI000901AD76|nr:PREDICTED: uncharacterized protein LOC109153867 [Ipomoea nil]
MVVRLASVLPRLLSPHQSGFVSGRSITDNILLASEMCHGITLGNQDIVLKLDMAKAYDRVSWFFLVFVMRKMGFSEVCIDLVYRAVSNVWYSVIVNGVKEGFFTSSRGLRQGDPLSPSLFIIAAEVLSTFLARVYQDEAVLRFSQPPGTPHIHHLSYADDVIIFSTGRQGVICKVIRALKDYEGISGQMVSFPKSAFYMHPDTSGRVIRRIRDITRCIHRSLPFTYLGCPIYVERKKCVYFSSVVDKVIRDLEQYFAAFFWRQSGGARYNWASWKTLSLPKKEGGVGFLDHDLMVWASSAKLWRNFRKVYSLWGSFMTAKYCSRVHPVAKQARTSDSHTWKRMLSVRNEVEAVLGWRLTHGDVNLWWDNWSGIGTLGRLYPFPGVEYFGDLLSDFIQDGELDLSAYDDLLPLGLEADMSRLGQRVADIPIWRVATDGLFSFSSAKSLFRPEPVQSDPLLSACWYKHLPFKVSFLSWRVLRGRLPTDDAMARFGRLIVSRCWCCNKPVRETIDHIFYAGDTARAVLGFFMGSLNLRFSHRGLRTLLTGWKRVVSHNRLVAFVICRLP